MLVNKMANLKSISELINSVEKLEKDLSKAIEDINLIKSRLFDINKFEQDLSKEYEEKISKLKPAKITKSKTLPEYDTLYQNILTDLNENDFRSSKILHDFIFSFKKDIIIDFCNKMQIITPNFSSNKYTRDKMNTEIINALNKNTGRRLDGRTVDTI
jgi:hypothetical protein